MLVIYIRVREEGMFFPRPGQGNTRHSVSRHCNVEGCYIIDQVVTNPSTKTHHACSSFELQVFLNDKECHP